ncbi:MAG: tRNA uracil 4-sulfurtransferase ThiI [Candidatus Aenigmatarchaeota archaeon]
MECVLVHYSEIGLKGKNRQSFELALVGNIRAALKGSRVQRLQGRLAVFPAKDAEEAGVRARLAKVPGISSFSNAIRTGKDMDEVKEALDSLIGGLKAGDVKTFAVDASRSDKGFPHTSMDMNRMLGDHVGKKTGWKVNLRKPDVTISVEVTYREAFSYAEKVKGMGGLPVGSGGTLVSLISGGLDSPVASMRMMRRGCEIVFVHFHNWTAQKDVVKDKVERLVKVLSEFQPRTVLYMVPFEEIQKEMVMKVPSDYRMIVYRRMMFRIAGLIAQKERALGFVTGDSVGQVASQTLENLGCIYPAAGILPVFSPLAGDNKEDIMGEARKIGTYDISILPYSDCCSFLVAEHPQTRARLRDVEMIEKNMDMEGLANKAMTAAEKQDF